MALTATTSLTKAQREMYSAIMNAIERVQYDFNPDEYTGVSTAGFAHIHVESGNCSGVRRLHSLARDAAVDVVQYNEQRDTYAIVTDFMTINASKHHDGGYRLSITNVAQLVGGLHHQRLDLQRDIHRILLEGFRERGVFDNACVRGRMD